MKRIEIIKEKTVFDDYFKIEEAILKFEKYNGSMSEPVKKLSFERGDAVAAVVFNKEKQSVILVEQFRYPTYRKGPGWICEVVAGMLKAGENADEAIRREVEEEIGYRVNSSKYIGTFYVSPGGTSERIILYYTEVSSTDKVNNGGGLAVEHEDIRILEFTLPELFERLESGELRDAKTIIGLMWLKEKLKFLKE